MSKHIKKTVSIVVCHHTGELIYPFVESVKKNCNIPYEIIIITSDEKLSLEGISGCITFYCDGLPAEKRNVGVNLAKAEYIAFFDDDVEIEPGCVEYMLRTIILKPNCGMVYGKLYKHGTKRFDEAGGFLTWNGFIWSRAEQNIPDEGQYDEEETIFSGKSASCIVRKRLFEDIRGFDESFGILGEESDLAWRIWLAGWKVYWCPQSLAYHKFNTPLKPFKKFYNSERVHFNGCRNYITMLIKNLGRSHLWIVPIHMMIWFTVGLAMVITGKFQVGWNILRGIAYVIMNLSTILRKRFWIQTHRRVSEKELWPAIYRVPSGAYYWTRFKQYLRSGIHG